MTGLPIDQLLDVTVCVAPLLDREEVAAWTSLDLFESVVVTAAYLRQNATEDFIAAIFDVSQATVSRRRTALEQPIAAALVDLKPDPAEVTRGDTVLVDGTLIPTSDWSDQHDLFSGKHHRTGMNVQIACTTGGRLLALGTPVHGSRHDVYAWKQSGLPELLTGTPIIADLGYVGIEGITTGTRRPAGGSLTDRQKSANQSLAAIRSVIEQTIAHVKNWKVLKHYRGPLDRFQRTLDCVEALYRLEHSHQRHPAP
jgi:hypothetical protein